MTETTRAKSVKKPADHKPASPEIVTVKHGGVEFAVARNAVESLRTLDMLERGMINSAIRRIVGDAKYDEFLDKNPEAGVEDAGALFESLADGVGVKNS